MMQVYPGLVIKQKNSDFIVREVPCLPKIFHEPKGHDYTILLVEKSGYTTFEIIDSLSRQLSLGRDTINCLGLKDEDGVTQQSISVRKTLADADIKKLGWNGAPNEKFVCYEIQGYSDTPLIEKKLHGNIFQILVRGLTADQAIKLQHSIKDKQLHVFLNYYDQQRFGLPDGPFFTHLIGEALVSKRYDQAADLYKKSGNYQIDGFNEEDINEDIFTKINPKKVDFFVSAYTSFLWNAALADIMPKTKSTVSIFGGYQLPSYSDVRIPVNLQISGYEFKDKEVQPYSKSRQSSVCTNIYVGKPIKDDINTDKFALKLEFFLPTGCYATMAVKQLLASRLG